MYLIYSIIALQHNCWAH